MKSIDSTQENLSPAICEQLKPRWSRIMARAGAATALAIILGVSYYPSELNNWPMLFSDSGNMLVFLKDFMKPDFSDITLYAQKMLETVYMAVWGTFLSVLFGIVFALLSSNNIAPYGVVLVSRRLMDAARAINELVFAILFVASVGLGPMAGVMALFIHNLGIISKLFSEAVEAIDMRPVEGIRSSGGGHLHEIIYGVIPQVLPLWASLTLYRFETNVRSATVLGIVGAGGIGYVFYESFRAFQYDRASAIIIVVVIAVSLIDVFSSRLRKILI
jgi:phosphonate transport system permease protein